MPDAFRKPGEWISARDDYWEIKNGSDKTKKGIFDLSNLSKNTIRKIILADADIDLQDVIHSNRTNLDSIDQDLSTTSDVVFDDVTGSLIKGTSGKFGDVVGGNYSEFETGGTYVMSGTSTVWRDENFSASTTAIGGSAPTLISWDTTNILVPAFGTANTKELNMLKEYDHAGKVGASITFHAHVFPTTNAAGTIKFYLEYYIKNDGNPAVTGTLNNLVSTNSTAWEELRLDLGTVTSVYISQGTQIGARLYRLNTDPGTYGANVAVSTWGYHYEIDTIGSRQITTK